MSGSEGFSSSGNVAILGLNLEPIAHGPGASWASDSGFPVPLLVVSVLGAFLLALVLSLLGTPHVRRLASLNGVMDMPASRKVHDHPMPRLGGLAIYASFLLAFSANLFFCARTGGPAPEDLQILGLVAGGGMAFGLGLWDDLRGLGPRFKFLVQIAAAGVAYVCGIGIHAVSVPWLPPIQLGVLALPATVFWFVLVINAINLIDGLDGLAAGVTVFSSVVLLILCLINHQLLIAAGLAALAGSTLGFLRYNFNPATIFMGDGGSYFIGFTLAALSVLGSMKSQASVTILIPILAMGLPLMDTLWSTIRRFLIGHELFRPDRDHLHHRLLRRGYTHRRAVLVLYGITAVMGVASLLMVHTTDHQAAIVLGAIGVGFALLIRKLGYVDYLTSEKILGWVHDVTDVMGMERGHRTFLGLQVSISEARTLEEAWRHIVEAARYLGMDYISLDLNGASDREHIVLRAHPGDPTIGLRHSPELHPERTMQIALPVGNPSEGCGHLLFAKQISTEPLEPYVLRRLAILHRTASLTLTRIYHPAVHPMRFPLDSTEDLCEFPGSDPQEGSHVRLNS